MVKAIATSLLGFVALMVVGCASETSAPSSSSEDSQALTAGPEGQVKPQDDPCGYCTDQLRQDDANCNHFPSGDERDSCRARADQVFKQCLATCA